MATVTRINSILESNKTLKAVEAAMKAKEWNKAVQIVDVIQVIFILRQDRH